MNKQELELRELFNRIGKKGDRQFSAGALCNALLRGGIRSVEQLKNTSKEDLLQLRHLGKKKVEYIMNGLKRESK